MSKTSCGEENGLESQKAFNKGVARLGKRSRERHQV